jgi:hypothetical protein
MPKYFDDERKLPFPHVPVTDSELDEPWLQKRLTHHSGKVSLCVRFDGFEADCLGYVFNIEQVGDSFHISDITGKQLLKVGAMRELLAMVLHVSGTRYDQNWQTEFQKLRNQIASG